MLTPRALRPAGVDLRSPRCPRIQGPRTRTHVAAPLVRPGRLGSARPGSARFGPAWLGPAWLSSHKIHQVGGLLWILAVRGGQGHTVLPRSTGLAGRPWILAVRGGPDHPSAPRSTAPGGAISTRRRAGPAGA